MSFHCLSLRFSAFPCGSAALTADRCNQADEQSGTIHEHHSYFAGICRQLDSKFTDATAAQVAKAAAQAETLERAM
eukprot:SAG22_NODE_3429_length_1717_cov_1.699629_3_plen_75_part_01